jgi:hypothetical protein
MDRHLFSIFNYGWYSLWRCFLQKSQIVVLMFDSFSGIIQDYLSNDALTLFAPKVRQGHYACSSGPP